jgi:hypothetical protein
MDMSMEQHHPSSPWLHSRGSNSAAKGQLRSRCQPAGSISTIPSSEELEPDEEELINGEFLSLLLWVQEIMNEGMITLKYHDTTCDIKRSNVI